jgi:hypothetical protein
MGSFIIPLLYPFKTEARQKVGINKVGANKFGVKNIGATIRSTQE